MLSFQKLDVYQCSIQFLSFSRNVLSRLPRGNAELVDQLRRSAQSIPLNVAEGVGKITRADKVKYFTIARGSAMESAAHLDVMRVDGLIDAPIYDEGIELLARIVSMLTRLIKP